MLIQERFKSPDKVFEKVYGIFDKRDYFNTKGLAKVQIRNFENFLKKGDKNAQALLDKFKGDNKKAHEYIIQVIHDRKKEQAFEDFKAFKSAVNKLELVSKGKSKEAYGASDLVKSRIHNNSQKYTIALYSAIRGKKFNNKKDVHADVDDLLAKNEGFKSDAQRKAAFASGYEEKGKKKNESVNEVSYNDALAKFNKDLEKNSQVKKIASYYKKPTKMIVKALQPMITVLRYKDKSIKLISINFTDAPSGPTKVHVSQTYKQNESVNELSDKDIKKAEQIRKSMPGFVGPKFAKKASNEDILAFADLQDKEAEIYNSKIKPIRDAKKKLYKKYRLTLKESVNEAYVVLYAPKKGVKPVTTAAYKDKKDAEKWAKDLGGITMIVKKKVKGIDEGKKRYYQQDRVGSAKYTISYHDGKKKHKDGSDFFDIKTFKNKKDLAKFVNTLHKGGYVYGFNESEDGVPQGYNPMVESKTKESKIIQKIYQYSKNEKKFYDELAKHEVRIGQRDYAKFIIMALKGFGINPRQYKRIPDAEEKLYQTVSK